MSLWKCWKNPEATAKEKSISRARVECSSALQKLFYSPMRLKSKPLDRGRGALLGYFGIILSSERLFPGAVAVPAKKLSDSARVRRKRKFFYRAIAFRASPSSRATVGVSSFVHRRPCKTLVIIKSHLFFI